MSVVRFETADCTRFAPERWSSGPRHHTSNTGRTAYVAGNPLIVRMAPISDDDIHTWVRAYREWAKVDKSTVSVDTKVAVAICRELLAHRAKARFEEKERCLWPNL